MRISYYKLSDCSGCMMNFFPLVRKIDSLEIVHFPNLTDMTKNDHPDVVIINGAVNPRDKELIQRLKDIRDSTEYLVALGSCACVGGITRFLMGEQAPSHEHINYVPLAEVLEVDFAVPGCPPATDIIEKLLRAIDAGNERYLVPFRNLSRITKASFLDLHDEIVSPGLCAGCGMCVLSCPVGAIHLVRNRPELRPDRCIRCGTCYFRCPRMFVKLRETRSGGKSDGV